MKTDKLKRIASIFIGAALPTLSLAPWLLIILLYAGIATISLFSRAESRTVTGLAALAFWLVFSIGAGSLVSLWRFSLFSAARVKARPAWRRLAYLTLLPATLLMLAGVIITFIRDRHLLAKYGSSGAGIFVGIILTAGIPCAIGAGFWYLPQLWFERKKPHWENIYGTKPADQVSWYRPHLDASLKLLSRLKLSPDDALIDIGAGASTLVDDLLERKFADVTVLDISAEALAISKKRLGAAAERVRWIEADVTRTKLPKNHYALWHDRAVFHFLTEAADRKAYAELLAASLKPGGHAIIATFSLSGPPKCSGLDVVRYSAESLGKELGEGFTLVDSFEEAHRTPFETVQNFVYCLFRKVV